MWGRKYNKNNLYIAGDNSEKSLTNTKISMLIDKIIIKETDEIGEYNRPKLDIEVVWNTPYLNVGMTEGLEVAV